ncbi:MAG: TetR/AcrR family transcriptional regulator [Ktedonobacterales bacterium]
MKGLPAESTTVEKFLDAAERLLIEVGYANISTRRLAEEAGANHGLVHYYFGSMEQLFIAVLVRFTDRLIRRQRAMYAANLPFIEKWRTAMAYLDEDLAQGYPKIWLELQALSWNHPELRERVAWVNGQWREVLTEAFTAAMAEYELDQRRFPVAAIVSLVMTFNMGILVERLSGIRDGQDVLLAMIDEWLTSLQAAHHVREGEPDASKVPGC